MRKGPTTFQIQILVLIILIAVFALAPQIGAQSNPSADEKIAPEVQAALADLAEGEMTTVIVTLVDQTDLGQIPGATHAARQQGVIRALQAQANASQQQITASLNAWQNQGKVGQYDSFWVFNGLSVTATQDVIYDLAARSDVWKITADDITILPTFAQTASPAEANLAIVQAPTLWESGFYGQGIVVANMDSGVDLNHPDLSSRWRGGSNSWFDPHDQNPTPTDLTGHGTWTMGVMVGADNGGSAIGVAPQAQWIAVKIFDNSGSSNATAIHNGFQWLMDPDGNPNTADAPHVVNNSWTMAYPSCDLEFELDIVSLRAVGILPIFAAGNGGPSSGTSYSPANNPSAFAVGATDNNDQIYGSSSRGPSACDQITFPDVVAPGVGILTADLFGFYTNASGTSLASPHVSGGLALLLSAFPDIPAAMQDSALIAGAVDLGSNGPDDDFGNGRLDLLASYQWLQDNPVPPSPTPTATPDASVNLALNQPISVSSFQDAEHNGAAVVDGDMATSWQTEKASGKNKLSSEWVKVDLGSAHSVDKVVMQWDTNFATSYTIQLSANDTDWTTVYSTTSGNGVDDTITFTAATARYVMVDSTAWESGRLRNWLREFEIYSAGGSSTTPTATPLPPTATPLPPTATSAPPTATSEPGTITSVHIGDLAASANSGSRNRWDALVTIIVHDESEYPFTGATVEGTWSEGASGTGSCVTNNAGTCTVNKTIKNNTSSVLFTVDTISGTDLLYSSIANHDPDGDSITVTQP